MNELKAWAEERVALWQLQIESFAGGKLRLEEQDGGDWFDITTQAIAQIKDDVARLRSILGRIEAGVEIDVSPKVGPTVEGLD